MISGVPNEWEQREAFQGELLNDETIEWVGQPDLSVHFSKIDIFLIPFSLFWGGFSLFWEASALGLIFDSANGGKPPVFFALFGIPFVVIGLYFIFGRFIYKAWKKRLTYYAVTNKRILILTLGRRRSIQAVFINTMPTINKFNGSKGTGSIVFGNSNWQVGIYSNTGMEWMTWYYGQQAPAFYDIKDACLVYDLVNRIRNQ